MNVFKLIVVFFFALYFSGHSEKAHAQSACNVNSFNNYSAACDQGTAYAQCKLAEGLAQNASNAAFNSGLCSFVSFGATGQGTYQCKAKSAAGNVSNCFLGGLTYYTYGGGSCTARNISYNGGTQDFKHIHNGAPQTCIAGCEIAHTGSVTTTDPKGSVLTSTTSSNYTGLVCGLPLPVPSKQYTNPPQPTDDKEICTPLGDGQTACLRADGKHCATSSKGNQYCWDSTQTGEQVSPDLSEVQRRNTGTAPSNLPLATVPPVGQTYNENNSHTIISNTAYTVTNYSTTNNYNSGNGGTTGTGSTGGSTGGTTGTGEVSNNAVTGDGSCGAPWICGGGDASNCAQLLELHELKCYNLGKDAQAQAFIDANPAPTDTPVGPWLDGGSGTGESILPDMGGLGWGSSCPEPPVINYMGLSKTIDFQGMCDIGAIIGMIVLLMASVQFVYIMGDR